jgi:hypothetical protein
MTKTNRMEVRAVRFRPGTWQRIPREPRGEFVRDAVDEKLARADSQPKPKEHKR